MQILDPSGRPVEKTGHADRIVAFLIDAVLTGALAFVPLVGWVAAPAYLLLRDGLPFLNGQSVGKRAMKLRAVTTDGLPLTANWGPAILRNAVLFIPLFPLIELIVLLSNEHELRLGDQWAGTRVQREMK